MSRKSDYRDAKTGQFVTERYAKAHPKTTVREQTLSTQRDRKSDGPRPEKSGAKREQAGRSGHFVAKTASRKPADSSKVSDSVPIPERRKKEKR